MLNVLPATLCVVFFVALASTALAAEASRPPNIVVILADDLGYKDVGIYGSTFYETPNLDRLAVEGMRFTDAYAACPVCSPTRASILTGQYPARIGLTDYLYGKARGKLIPAVYVDHLPLDLFNLPRALQQSGYTTWHIGKWHLGREPYYPREQGFDVNIAGSHRGHPNHGYFSPWKLEHLENAPEGTFLTDALTDHAVELIRNNEDKPFYLSYWSYAPHTPIQAPEALVEKYEKKAAAMGLDKVEAMRQNGYFPTENKRDQRITRRVIQSDPVYAAMIANLDANIGRLLQAIDDAGQAENTIVIFTSDNGGLSTAEGAPTCNDPLAQGKGWMYEGGIRVPLIVRWPGVVRQGTISQEPVTTPDLLPTLLAAVDVDIAASATIDGVNLLPALKGAALDRQAIYWHYPHYGNQGGTPASAVRAGEWKLIRHYEKDHVELYNLKTDISESQNVAAEHPEMVKKLTSMLDTWLTDMGAKHATPNPHFKPRTEKQE